MSCQAPTRELAKIPCSRACLLHCQVTRLPFYGGFVCGTLGFSRPNPFSRPYAVFTARPVFGAHLRKRPSASVCESKRFPRFSFCRSNLILCEKGCDRHFKIAILLQFLPIEPHLVRNGSRGHFKIAILEQLLPIEPHFVRKGCRGHFKTAILQQFLTIEPHFVR